MLPIGNAENVRTATKWSDASASHRWYNLKLPQIACDPCLDGDFHAISIMHLSLLIVFHTDYIRQVRNRSYKHNTPVIASEETYDCK